MNNIKKATSLISPEPLLNARRSSLPLSFDTANGNSPLLDVIKKFNYSPRCSNGFVEAHFQLPQIVCKSPSPPQVVQSPLNRRPSDFKTISPTLWKNTGEAQEISPKRLPPLLHFPSLSPCFEDKPKQNSFPFPSQNSPTIRRGDSTDHSEREFSEKNTNKWSSVYRIQSPTFPQNTDRILTPNSKIRRNSLGSTGFLSFSNEILRQLELQEGNLKLMEKNRYFSLNSVLGKGGFGIVKVECWQGEKVAIKILKERKSLASIKNEEYSLGFGSHSNLVETKAVVISKDSFRAEIKTSNFKKKNEDFCPYSYVLSSESLQTITGLNEKLFPENFSLIISELCTSDTLLSVINLNIDISDQDKLKFLYQIASALQHMHEKGYVHLDVKPSNCFVSQSGTIKLGDFGCTCKLNDIPAYSLGTVAYQAPEALKGNPVTDRCDIYSLGITAWQLLTRESPYPGQHPHVIIYKVTRMKCRPTTEKEMKTFIENALFSLAEKCWFEIPSERPRIETLISILQSLYFASFPITKRGKSFKKSSF
ncbi:Serine/threonine-protein kinase mos [Armadillidium nasatum]|uniref:non-specific serine/threonine protein kinase n=1 Tax=Armadillidium nasatum TaxID=96803 RepID=A0A5N5TBY3_9CRUS|nr:Serine/threonine-protein kinase mos [Armadillidium nasatum]